MAGGSRQPDTAEELCRRLRGNDADTCARYLETQALWWRTFGWRRCLLVGDAAAGLAQGFVVDAFETVLRLHDARRAAKDVGDASRGVRCDSVRECELQAARLGCRPPGADAAASSDLSSGDGNGELVALGREKGLSASIRTLLTDIFLPKHGVFGAPPTPTA